MTDETRDHVAVTTTERKHHAAATRTDKATACSNKEGQMRQQLAAVTTTDETPAYSSHDR